MQIKRRSNSFTLIELLVVISIIALLAGLALPAMNGAITKAQLMAAVSNMRQIHIGVQGAALDYSNTQVGIGWPFDAKSDTSANVSSPETYVTALLSNGIFKIGDMKVFIAGSGYRVATSSTTIATNNLSFYIYEVADSDESNTVFLSTKNLDYSGTASTAAPVSALGGGNPFGLKGFGVFRKGGDGAFFTQANVVTSTTTIGIVPAAAGNKKGSAAW